MPSRARSYRVAAVLVVLLTLTALLAGCGGDGGGDATLPDPSRGARRATSTTTTSPPAWQSYSAQASKPTLQVFSAPDTTTLAMELPNPWVVDPAFPDQTVPQVFLVKQQKPEWVEVLLPVRPNGSSGWVRAADVVLSSNSFHINVALGARTITVTDRDKVIYTGPVAVGKPSTPTPVGEYYLRVLIQAIDPGTVYGPFAYGLSSHSEVLETFAGGDAEIGIHGNDDASVLGSDVTSGCVRIDNDAITMLSAQLPLGTPVDIVA